MTMTSRIDTDSQPGIAVRYAALHILTLSIALTGAANIVALMDPDLAENSWRFRNVAIALLAAGAYRLWVHERLVELLIDWGWHGFGSVVLAGISAIIGVTYTSVDFRSPPAGATLCASFALSVLLGFVATKSLHRLQALWKTGYTPRAGIATNLFGATLPAILFLIVPSEIVASSLLGFPVGAAVAIAQVVSRRRNFIFRRSYGAPLIVPLTFGQHLPQDESDTIKFGDTKPSIRSGAYLMWKRPIAKLLHDDPRTAFRIHMFKGDTSSAKRLLPVIRLHHGEYEAAVAKAYLDFFDRRPGRVLAAYYANDSEHLRDEAPASQRLAALAACVYRNSGDYERAESLLRSRLVPQNLNGREYVLATLSDVLSERNEPNAAFEAISEAYGIAPGCPLIAGRYAFYGFKSGSVPLGDALDRIIEAHNLYQQGIEDLGFYSLSRRQNQTVSAVLNAINEPTWSMTLLRMMASLVISQATDEPDPNLIRFAQRLLSRCHSIDPMDAIVSLNVAQLAIARARLASSRGESTVGKWLDVARRESRRTERLLHLRSFRSRGERARKNVEHQLDSTVEVIDRLQVSPFAA